MNSDQLVSIIITTRNEEKLLERLIRSIKKQSYKNKEIIIVDNNSSDSTIEVIKRLKVAAYNFGPERSAQRNFGAGVSKGKHLLFLDADMELTKNVIKECVEVVKRNKVIGGVIIPEKSIAFKFWEKIKAFERSFYNLEGDNVTDAARFFPKSIFLKCRGYDKNITGPEDWDLTENIKKRGYKIVRITSFIFHRERISSIWDLAKKKFYYGLDLHRYLKKQKVSIINSKTVYFLRPVFYKNFDKLLMHPILSIGLVIMFTVEFLAGGLGYIVGRAREL